MEKSTFANQKTYNNITNCFKQANTLITISGAVSFMFSIALAVTMVIGFGKNGSGAEPLDKYVTIIQGSLTIVSMIGGYVYRLLNMKALKKAQTCVMTCSTGGLDQFSYRIGKMRKALLWDSALAGTPFRYVSSIIFTIHYRAFKKQLKLLKVRTESEEFDK